MTLTDCEPHLARHIVLAAAGSLECAVQMFFSYMTPLPPRSSPTAAEQTEVKEESMEDELQKSRTNLDTFK
eukprot:1968557-Heterocapsa_arctica.AAC.1